MNSTPTVSVCMTTYNHAPYIAQAIESVLAQRTSFGVELIVGEDCSTDSTAEICRRYAEQYPERVRIVSSETNVGWRANYRRTIAAARGKYIALCDGDDWWSDPTKLQSQVEALEAAPECAMCYTRSERRADTSGESHIYPAGECHTSFEDMLRLNTAENSTTVAKREVVERYYAEVRPDMHPEWLTDDLPMWLWVSAHYPICYIDRVTATHRILATSVSHSNDYRRRLAFCDSLADIMLWFDERYGERRMHRFLARRKQNVALWTLSHNGTVGDYLARWTNDVRHEPILLFNVAAYGLFVKKIFYRMWVKR
jgi:glycosyltransferase involved in cell wall biosynthesis